MLQDLAMLAHCKFEDRLFCECVHDFQFHQSGPKAQGSRALDPGQSP